MIPKVIHYCWFGKKPLPLIAEKCIDSWRKFLPEYYIQEWNEENFNVNIILYTKQAYENKKYAFVSDYARFWILYHYGGVYFDTDVEIIKPMSNLIEKGPFMGCETDGKLGPAVIGLRLAVNPGLGLAVYQGHYIYKQLLNTYSKLPFIKDDGTMNYTTVVSYTTNVLIQNGLQNHLDRQSIKDITIYPRRYFNPKTPTGKINISKETYSIHHYASSWLTPYQKLKYKFVSLLQMNKLGCALINLYQRQQSS